MISGTTCNAARGRAAGLLALALVLSGVRSLHAQNDPPRVKITPGIALQLNEPVFTSTLNGEMILPTAEELKNVKIDPALRAIVQQLEDPSFAVREQATKQLIENAPDKMQLYALLYGEETLTPEQRYRLLGALRESLLSIPRGAVGISMQPFQPMMGGPMEIRVTELIPGLPAERVLKIGDRITQVDGQPLAMFDDLQFRVQSKKPGEKVSLVIKRPRLDAQGRQLVDANNEALVDVLPIELELGSAEVLRRYNEATQFPNQAGNPFGNQGNRQLSQRVETMRQAEAETAARKFGPMAHPVAVDANSHLVAAKSTSPDEPAPLDPEVERHPLVQAIRTQQNLISQGRVTLEQKKLWHDQWQVQLYDLYRQTQNRQLTRSQQEYLQQVIERFAELMQQP